MKETKTQTLYTSPEVKMVEIKKKRMFCVSPQENGLQTFGREDWDS